MDYDVMLSTGSSTLSKAMSLSLEELGILVAECRSELTPEQIKAKVETIKTKSLDLVCDGTYI